MVVEWLDELVHHVALEREGGSDNGIAAFTAQANFLKGHRAHDRPGADTECLPERSDRSIKIIGDICHLDDAPLAEGAASHAFSPFKGRSEARAAACLAALSAAG
jgi:hypothetical protein